MPLCQSFRQVSLRRCWKLTISSMVRRLFSFRSNVCRLLRLKMAWGTRSKSQCTNSSSVRFTIFFRLFSMTSLVPSLQTQRRCRWLATSTMDWGILVKLLFNVSIFSALSSRRESMVTFFDASELKEPIRWSSSKFRNTYIHCGSSRASSNFTRSTFKFSLRKEMAALWILSEHW